jgi:hypothetical protein
VTLPDFNASRGADAGAGESDPANALSLDSLTEAKDQLSKGDTASATSSIQGMMSSGIGAGGPSMGAGALAPLAMGMIYPQLKAMLEASIRKVTVRVVWSEGKIEREISITQYITNPQQGGFLAEDESMAGAGGGAGQSGVGQSGVGTRTGTGGRSGR